MESINTNSLMAILAGGLIIGMDMLNLIPNNISCKLSNKRLQLILGVGIFVAAYFDISAAIVIACILYVSLNDKDVDNSSNSEENKVKVKSKVKENSESDVNGIELVEKSGDNVLPTQDNSAPQESELKEEDVELPDGVDPTMLNKEDLSELVGLGDSEMAKAL